MSLRARLAAFMAVTVGVTVALVAVYAYRSASSEALAEVDRSLLGRVPIGGFEVPSTGPGPGQGPGGQGGGGGRRQDLASLISDDVLAQLLLPDGIVVILGDSEVPLPVTGADLVIARGDGEDFLRTITFDDRTYRMITRPLPQARGAVQIARDLTETEAILDGLRTRLLLFGLAGAAVAALAGWLLAGRAVRPVRDLTGAAEQVAATGALDAAIPVRRSDEVGRLATAFNEMLARLETSRAAQQRLVADASHELRTPLTSVRTNIELLARGGVPEAERAGMLQDLRAEVVELGDLVSELVDLATVGRDDETAMAVDLADLAETAVTRARRRAGQPFVLEIGPVPATVRRGAVTRAFSNLVDNAVKWSPPDGEITVRLDGAGFTVEDRGPGFDPADLPQVFQRFYRAAAARSLPGSGLGLAIVAAVAEDHGWTVFAENRTDGGARVGMRFVTA